MKQPKNTTEKWKKVRFFSLTSETPSTASVGTVQPETRGNLTPKQPTSYVKARALKRHKRFSSSASGRRKRCHALAHEVKLQWRPHVRLIAYSAALSRRHLGRSFALLALGRGERRGTAKNGGGRCASRYEVLAANSIAGK